MDKEDPTYFAIIYTDVGYPELEAVNGGEWLGDNYLVEFDDSALRLVKDVNIFESPEAALDAAVAEVYKGIDIDIQELKGNCRYMKRIGEQLHDPHIQRDGYTPYDSVLIDTTALPVKFAAAAAALQKFVTQYAHLLEVAYG